MTTRMTATLVSRVSRRARALPSLNLKKKRNRSQSIQEWDLEGVYFLDRLTCSVFEQGRGGGGGGGGGAYLKTQFLNKDNLITIHVTRCNFYRFIVPKRSFGSLF